MGTEGRYTTATFTQLSVLHAKYDTKQGYNGTLREGLKSRIFFIALFKFLSEGIFILKILLLYRQRKLRWIRIYDITDIQKYISVFIFLIDILFVHQLI